MKRSKGLHPYVGRFSPYRVSHVLLLLFVTVLTVESGHTSNFINLTVESLDSKMPSVTEFVKRINASDKFLKSVAALPTYKDIEILQYKKLDEFLSTCKWNEEEVANAVTAMGMVERFSESSKKKILTKLASLCCEREKAKPKKGPSSSGQDYSSLHRFIPPTLWKDLAHEDVLQRTHSLCKHGARLGLCQPTELTLRTLVCCVFWASWSTETIPPGEKYRLGQGLKPTLRHVLKEYSSEAEHLRLDKLPPIVEELPATHQGIFDDEFLVWDFQCFFFSCLKYSFFLLSSRMHLAYFTLVFIPAF